MLQILEQLHLACTGGFQTRHRDTASTLLLVALKSVAGRHSEVGTLWAGEGHLEDPLVQLSQAVVSTMIAIPRAFLKKSRLAMN